MKKIQMMLSFLLLCSTASLAADSPCIEAADRLGQVTAVLKVEDAKNCKMGELSIIADKVAESVKKALESKPKDEARLTRTTNFVNALFLGFKAGKNLDHKAVPREIVSALVRHEINGASNLHYSEEDIRDVIDFVNSAKPIQKTETHQRSDQQPRQDVLSTAIKELNNAEAQLADTRSANLVAFSVFAVVCLALILACVWIDHQLRRELRDTGAKIWNQGKHIEQINAEIKLLRNRKIPDPEVVTALCNGFEELSNRISSLEGNARKLEPSEPFTETTLRDLFSTWLREDRDREQKTFQEAGARVALETRNTLSPVASAAKSERQILKAAWDAGTVLKTTPPLHTPAGGNSESKMREALVTQLPRLLERWRELKVSCELALAPLKEFDKLIVKISFIPSVADGAALDDEVKNLLRIRECSNFVYLLHNTDLFADKLNFRLEKWVQEQFLGFADLFLRTYQKAQLDGGATDLVEARGIVLRTLKVADLEPIEIILGETHFDSSQHVGRSTASRLDLDDGSIVSVIRNGFRQGSTGTVVRQPEVIVNRH